MKLSLSLTLLLAFVSLTVSLQAKKKMPLNDPVPTPPSAADTMSPADPTKPGIALDPKWDSPLGLSTGGHSLEIKNLSVLLASYGTPGDDLGAHPAVTIYPGVTYLMPLADAEKVLVKGYTGISNKFTLAVGGFPTGLKAYSYDTRLGNYNHLLILTDLKDQVVAIEYQAEHVFFLQPLDWENRPGNWHVYDYPNARVKGQPNIQIITQIKNSGDHIGVHTASNHLRYSATWYVPKPLIALILHCAQNVK